MANPTTPRMVGKCYGNLVVLKPTGKKQGPHMLYLCWLNDGSPLGEMIVVRGNNLRQRGYVGEPIRRKP